MTKKQRDSVFEIFAAVPNSTLHHGDCVGADAQAHDIAIQFDFKIAIHPPENNAKRAFKTGPKTQVLILAPRPYLERNCDIVDSCEILVAAPQVSEEEMRSGTWATIRYARRKQCRVVLIMPNGKQVQIK